MSYKQYSGDNESLSKNPELTISDNIAYLPQKTLIFPATVKYNIILEMPYDKDKFKWAIKYSALEEDIKLLTHGVDTELSESGDTLSGGQRVRVA